MDSNEAQFAGLWAGLTEPPTQIGSQLFMFREAVVVLCS